MAGEIRANASERLAERALRYRVLYDLDSFDQPTRERALAALADKGWLVERYFPKIVEHLQAYGGAERVYVLEIVAKLAPTYPPAADALVDALRNPHPAVRKAAAKLIVL